MLNCLLAIHFNASLQFYCPYCTRSSFVEMIPYIMKLSLRLMNCCTVDTVFIAGKTMLLHAKMYSILSKSVPTGHMSRWPNQRNF